jgi:cyclopropane fatty-acyl-phospholipid synthase-like methyltransferase
MSRFARTRRLLRLIWQQKRSSVVDVYDVISTHNHLGEKGLYLNFGYWDGATTYDGACERLAEVLATAAGMAAGQRVLDCGCGFADQDMFWLRRFDPATIDGLNITLSQVVLARQRVATAGASDRIRLHCGSATRMPFADGSFDCVVALESASHFVTREDFLREAMRVLAPGGRLAIADMVRGERPMGRIERFLQSHGRGFWQEPAANVYPRSEYERKLEAAGFGGVKVDSIAPHVFAPLIAFARRRLRAPDVRRRMDPILRWSWMLALGPMSRMSLDYILAVAEKPRAAP